MSKMSFYAVPAGILCAVILALIAHLFGDSIINNAVGGYIGITVAFWIIDLVIK